MQQSGHIVSAVFLKKIVINVQTCKANIFNTNIRTVQMECINM